MAQPPASSRVSRRGHRYELIERLASGGMGTVHLARVNGPGGFRRTVAVKTLHPEYARDVDAATMLLDEARLAARVNHPNVVATLDIVADNEDLLLVMEFVLGESLARLFRVLKEAGARVPPPIASAIMGGVLAGLHAAHEARGDGGEPLCIVHRDVSPQNVLVGADGIARVLDFGIAKAEGRLSVTIDGALKGKPAYMSPEQARGHAVDRRTDVYAAGVVLWEMLTGRRAFVGANSVEIILKVLEEGIAPPTSIDATLSPALDGLVARAVARSPADRWPTTLDFAAALEAAVAPATTSEVSDWVKGLVGAELAERAVRFGQPVPIATPRKLSAPPPPADELIATVRTAAAGAPSGAAILLAIAAGLVVGVGVLAGIAFRRPASPAAPPPPAASTSVPAGVETADTPTEALPSATAPSSGEHARSGIAPERRRDAGRARRESCSPPYRVGADGILVPKPECL